MGYGIAVWAAIGLGAQFLFALVYYGIVCGSSEWPYGAVLPFPWGAAMGLGIGLVVQSNRTRRRADKS